MGWLFSVGLFQICQIVVSICICIYYVMYVFIITSQVIQWCTYHHKDDPTQPEDDDNEDDENEDDAKEEEDNIDIVAHSDSDLFEYSICSWDAEFLKVDQGTLFELILVSC